MNRFSRIVLRLVFSLWPFYSVRAHHAERVPDQGAVVFVPKHQRYFDIPALTVSTERQVRYMAKKSLFRNPLAAWYMTKTGAFPVEQGAPDRTALKTAARKLSEGEALGIFVEGTRIPGNVVGETEPGLLLAIKMSKVDCLLVPCGICYGRRGIALAVDVYFGQPFHLEDCGSTNEEMLAGIRARMQDAQDQAFYAS